MDDGCGLSNVFYTATGRDGIAGAGSATDEGVGKASCGGGLNKSSCCEDFGGAINSGRIISG